MSDGVLIALITSGFAALGGVALWLVRRFVPPRKPSTESVDMTKLWDQVRALREDVDSLVDERDTYRTTSRILADSNDALTAAVSRAIPPIVFTAGEQQAIDRALSRRAEDDYTWPTKGGAGGSSAKPRIETLDIID